MDKFDHLWNDLPESERHRLMPYQIEIQIRQLKQARKIVVEGHRRTLFGIDYWIKNLEVELAKTSAGTGDGD